MALGANAASVLRLVLSRGLFQLGLVSCSASAAPSGPRTRCPAPGCSFRSPPTIRSCSAPSRPCCSESDWSPAGSPHAAPHTSPHGRAAHGVERRAPSPDRRSASSRARPALPVLVAAAPGAGRGCWPALAIASRGDGAVVLRDRSAQEGGLGAKSGRSPPCKNVFRLATQSAPPHDRSRRNVVRKGRRARWRLGHLRTSEVGEVLEHLVRRLRGHLAEADSSGPLRTRRRRTVRATPREPEPSLWRGRRRASGGAAGDGGLVSTRRFTCCARDGTSPPASWSAARPVPPPVRTESLEFSVDRDHEAVEPLNSKAFGPDR
jgi:hypothetical protein